MSKSPWLPVIFSLIVIIVSILIISPTSISSTPALKTNFATPSPAPLFSPSVTPSPADYTSTYFKCGQLPLLPDYSSSRFAGNYSPRLWSPSCRFVAWSATISGSFGNWKLSPYEGLFIYDLKTKKVTRIYTPQSSSDIVHFLRWLDDTHLVFRLDLKTQEYVYNMSIKTYSPL